MRSGLADIPRRAKNILRQEGLRSFAFKVLGETFYRRLALVERVPQRSSVRVSSQIDVSFRPLTLSELSAYRELRPETANSELVRRIEAGHTCIVGWYAGRIISARWLGLNRCRIDYLDIEISLAPDTAYLCETFTAAEYRGRRVATAGAAVVEEILYRNGTRRELAAIWPENRAGQKTADRAGFTRVGTVGYLGVDHFRYRFCTYRGPRATIRII